MEIVLLWFRLHAWQAVMSGFVVIIVVNLADAQVSQHQVDVVAHDR